MLCESKDLNDSLSDGNSYSIVHLISTCNLLVVVKFVLILSS